jgi:response regulator RpfG family c-di-GMP phosphodiesterase
MIISDVAMPDTDGFEFCRMTRQIPELSETLFVLVSGIEIDSDDVVRGFHVGADDYLLKPFSHEVFTAKISSLLRIKHYSESCRHYQKKALAEEKLKIELQTELLKEKEILNNSLKQIMYMTKERDSLTEKNNALKQVIKNDTEGFCSVLSEIIESRAQYHRGHAINVSEISVDIARSMKIAEDEINDIKMAALLHEAGKIAIPDELLSKKPENYSRFEADFLIQHPAKGASFLDKLSAFQKTATIIRHIHEKVDGTGFPDGLKKNRIPVGSLIISAVSAYDNLVIRLKKATPQQALDLLESKIGTHYDHKVIHHLRKYIGNKSTETADAPTELRIYEVKPGMTLAAGIFTTKGAKLLPENCVLTEESIEQIARYNKIDLVEDSVFVK